MNIYEEIGKLKKYADINNVPIIQDDGIDYLTKYIAMEGITNILEIGSAIGYSAIMMALSNPNIKVTTVERDENRYLEAVKNIKKFDLEKRITILFKDALDVDLDGEFDLIFIDAAKGQNIKFFEKFELNLKDGGTIITDNMNFHGLVQTNIEDIKSRNLRQLIRKIKEYRIFLENNKHYQTEILNIGDGLAVSKHIKKDKS